jgi:selenide,water dikinase
VHPDRIVTTHGAPAGSELILTKRLGTGIISAAIKNGNATPAAVESAVAQMTTLNRSAAEVMRDHEIRHATDVTGFGLVGHLLEMLGTNLSARLEWSSIPILEDALALAPGNLPGGTRRNAEVAEGRVTMPGLDEARRWLLFDAQTSGGLLMAVPDDRFEAVLDDLHDRGVADASVIGSLHEGDGSIEVVE